jgi:tRNA(adenine34) deaminase
LNGLTREEKYMREAVREAKKAAKKGEVPIGCVIVLNDRIIGRGYNRRMTDRSALAHAEIYAIKRACKHVKDWRLDETEMYVTLEPCQMCSGAIIQARIRRLFIGAMNPKAGCAGSLLNIFEVPGFNHRVEVERGILEEECAAMLKTFFAELRQPKTNRKNLDTGNDGTYNFT